VLVGGHLARLTVPKTVSLGGDGVRTLPPSYFRVGNGERRRPDQNASSDLVAVTAGSDTTVSTNNERTHDIARRTRN